MENCVNCSKIAISAAVLACAAPARAEDAAVQHQRCIDLAAAHQVVAGSRNVRIYPDQALEQLRADKSFKFSDAEKKAIVNSVYFGSASQIAQPMTLYKAVYEACARGGADTRWKPVQ